MHEIDIEASLTEAYGVRPPDRVLEWARVAYEYATRQGYFDKTDYLACPSLPFDLAGLAQRPVYEAAERYSYPSTPPELFVFGNPGADGIHYGFVVYAPEVVEYPLAANANDGVRELGRLSQSCIYSPAWPALQPQVPEGWRHRPTSDGIGVLAPESAFGREPDVDTGFKADSVAVERAARKALMRGAPAQALLVLREFLGFNCGDAQAATAGSLMVDAYRALGRGLLAEIMAEHVAKHWQSAE